MEQMTQKTNTEPKFRILYNGSSCSAWSSPAYHNFEHLEKEKIFFCKWCGLTIKYGKVEEKGNK